MAESKKEEKKSTLTHSGIPMSEESLKDYENTWKQMDECIDYVNKKGIDVQ